MRQPRGPQVSTRPRCHRKRDPTSIQHRCCSFSQDCQFSNKMSSSQFQCRRDVINDMKLRIEIAELHRKLAVLAWGMSRHGRHHDLRAHYLHWAPTTTDILKCCFRTQLDVITRGATPRCGCFTDYPCDWRPTFGGKRWQFTPFSCCRTIYLTHPGELVMPGKQVKPPPTGPRGCLGCPFGMVNGEWRWLRRRSSTCRSRLCEGACRRETEALTCRSLALWPMPRTCGTTPSWCPRR